MEALLIGVQKIYTFVIHTDRGDLFVTWNKHNHTSPTDEFYIPEFVIVDDNDILVDNGSQDALDAIEAVKKWNHDYVITQTV